MARCCPEFATTARAGDGLPAVEPGTPAPAGTGLSRRTFLARGIGGMLAVYGASQLGFKAFEEGIAAASGHERRVLVNVFLPGGLDSLSVLAPTGDSRYATLRPTLAVAPDAGWAFPEDDRLRWAPAAQSLRTLHAEGKVTVLPAVGYAHPDQSHFTSQHFWEVGECRADGAFGWLGRFLDRHGAPDNPLQGITLDGSLAPALAAGSVPVAAVPDPTNFGLGAWRVSDPVLGPMYTAIGRLGGLATDDPALRTVRLAASQVDQLRRDLLPLQGGGAAAPVPYPSGTYARRLRGLAAMLAHGLPVRVAAIRAPGGYDTHADQASTLADDVRETFDGLLAFQRDLEARGLADRVLIQVWSEFGRRPRQNGDGTDHGAAGIGFVIGSRARGTQVGEFPGLATLDAQGNLRHTSDFRAVYCSILEQWLGVDAGPIIPGAAGFARPALLKS